MRTHTLARTLVGVAALAGALSACDRDVQPDWPRAIDASLKDVRIDCPGHLPVIYRSLGGDSAVYQTLSVPGPITRIPEFHDCQRLLIDQAVTYGPLVGVWASNTLDDTSSAGPVLPMAEVVDFDQVGYEPLGVGPGFNCLYVMSDAQAPFGIRAVMVQAGANEAACGRPYDPAMAGADLMAVPYEAPSGLSWDDIPRVARWEWDPVTRRQYIGLRCGLRWCEVGPQGGFGSSAGHNYPMTERRERRTFWIKGWYDEQQLARKAGGSLHPLGAVGTIVPDSALGDYSDATFPGNVWVPAARIALRPPQQAYATKLGLGATAIPRNMDRLQLCHGSWSACATASGSTPAQPKACTGDPDHQWWARIIRRQGAETYFCVIRTAHPGIQIEGTARWRWMKNDETIWVRCAEGCCQVNPNEES
ncbi:MAG: hypothetical protein ACREJ4_16010 [Candidatus Methylomirabilaceae bacterium]